MEKEGRAVGVEHRGRLGHDPSEKAAEIELGREVGDDVQEVDLAAARARGTLDELHRLQRHRTVCGDPLEQAQVGRRELAVDLVQHLGGADRLALRVLHRRAQDRLGAEARLPVDLLVEARVGVGVLDDLADTAVVDGADDAEVVENADLARAEVGGLDGVQLPRVVVVQEERPGLRTQLGLRRLDERVEDGVEGIESGHLARQPQHHLELLDLLDSLGESLGHASPPFGCPASSCSRSATTVAWSSRSSSRWCRSSS